MMRRTLKTLLLMLMAAMTLMSGSLPDWDALMLKAGMVKVTDLCDSFVVDLRYAGTRNFVGKNMYGSFNGVYLHPDAAKSLVAAQKALKKITNPGTDASIRRKMNTVRFSVNIFSPTQPVKAKINIIPNT